MVAVVRGWEAGGVVSPGPHPTHIHTSSKPSLDCAAGGEDQVLLTAAGLFQLSNAERQWAGYLAGQRMSPEVLARTERLSS